METKYYAEYPRYNFNDIASGAIVIFTLLTGENWDQTMLLFAHYDGGYTAILFFISFVIIGVMIFLNLFLAILLENFQDDENYQVKNNGDSTLGERVNKFIDYVGEGCKEYWEYIKDECKEKKVEAPQQRSKRSGGHHRRRRHRRSRNRDVIVPVIELTTHGGVL